MAGKKLGAAHLLTAGMCTQGEAQSFGGRRRSISWRDRAGVALAEEDSQGMVSRERSSHGFLPDVHEEVRRPHDAPCFLPTQPLKLLCLASSGRWSLESAAAMHSCRLCMRQSVASSNQEGGQCPEGDQKLTDICGSRLSVLSDTAAAATPATCTWGFSSTAQCAYDPN